jgi:hypothetical protein
MVGLSRAADLVTLYLDGLLLLLIDVRLGGQLAPQRLNLG